MEVSHYENSIMRTSTTWNVERQEAWQ